MLKLPRHFRALLKPQVILPVLLAAALLAFAFSLGNIGDALARLGRLPIRVLALALLAATWYLMCKAAQLKLMLARIDVHVPARPFWLAFAVGEMTVTLPLGIFSQNWILSATRRVHIGRSSAATVMMVLVEIAVVFLYLSVVGIPGWYDTRPLAIALLAVLCVVVGGTLLFEDRARRLALRLRGRRTRRAAAAALELLHGMRELTNPALLAAAIVIAAIYLGAITFGFWAVGRGMEVHHLGYLTATTIYMFALGIVLIGAGIFSQIGTLELLGMVVARAWGIGYTDGLAMMLGFRIVWTGAIWLLCLPIAGSLWRELPRRTERISGDRSEEVSG